MPGRVSWLLDPMGKLFLFGRTKLDRTGLDCSDEVELNVTIEWLTLLFFYPVSPGLKSWARDRQT
jgi:hypothetical protein